MFLGEELLVFCPTPNLEKQPPSAVRYCLCKFTAKIHIWQQSSLASTRGGSMPWWGCWNTGTWDFVLLQCYVA